MYISACLSFCDLNLVYMHSGCPRLRTGHSRAPTRSAAAAAGSGAVPGPGPGPRS